MENNTRIVTGEVRFGYVNLMKPQESQLTGEDRFSVFVMVPKTDTQTKQKIDDAINAAIEKGKSSKWNGVAPPNVSTPIHDGDGVRKSDGEPFGPECAGHWVFTATSKPDQPPKIVDASVQPILDQTEVYSGMYGRIAVNFNPYFASGSKGIGVYIATNVQKTRDGEPLGGADPAATEDFGGAPQQPQQPQQQQIDPITGQPKG